MRQFLDRLPLVMQAKAEPGSQPRWTTRDAGHRVAANGAAQAPASRSSSTPRSTIAASTMRYHSFSSNREKDYVLEPYRLVFAQGGLYVVAFVPEYKQLRTFAVERILSLSLTEERFEPMELAGGRVRALARRQSGHARAHRDRVRAADRPLRQGARVARVAARSKEPPDGTLTMTLNVCNDWALRSWILGFGPLARVVSPPELAAQILEEIERTRSHYVPRRSSDRRVATAWRRRGTGATENRSERGVRRTSFTFVSGVFVPSLRTAIYRISVSNSTSTPT